MTSITAVAAQVFENISDSITRINKKKKPILYTSNTILGTAKVQNFSGCCIASPTFYSQLNITSAVAVAVSDADADINKYLAAARKLQKYIQEFITYVSTNVAKPVFVLVKDLVDFLLNVLNGILPIISRVGETLHALDVAIKALNAAVDSFNIVLPKIKLLLAAGTIVAWENYYILYKSMRS